MTTIITLDALTQNSVSVKTQKIIIQDGVSYEIGEPHRCAYVNSVSGRKQLAAALSDPYLSAVLAMWGNTPTVEDIEESINGGN